MFKPVRTVDPAADVVPVELMRKHVRLVSAADDELLQFYLSAAVAHLDGWDGVLGRCLISQTWRQDFAEWPCRGDILALPFPGVSEIVSVKYFDADGVEQTVSASLYELKDMGATSVVRLKDAFTYPALDDDLAAAVSVTFTAGYGATADEVPADIRAIVMLLAATWYENRESIVIGQTGQALPDNVGRLITGKRGRRVV